MAATTVPNVGTHPTISDKGARGFLKWMKSDPVMSKVYAKIKPQLAQSLGVTTTLGFLGFGDDTSSTDLTSADLSSGSVDYSSLTSGVDTSGVSTSINDAVTSAAPTDSSSSSSWLSNISSLISAAGTAVLTADQISTANKVTNLQISQAQAGKAPINLSAYGLSTTPGVNLGLSSSTQNLLMWGGVGLLGVWLLTSLTKRRS